MIYKISEKLQTSLVNLIVIVWRSDANTETLYLYMWHSLKKGTHFQIFTVWFYHNFGFWEFIYKTNSSKISSIPCCSISTLLCSVDHYSIENCRPIHNEGLIFFLFDIPYERVSVSFIRHIMVMILSSSKKWLLQYLHDLTLLFTCCLLILTIIIRFLVV